MFPPSMPSFNPVNDAEVFNGFGTAYIRDVSSVNGSMLSFNPVNDAEVFNGFGMQSHPNVENRSLGCNEGVVYEEALQQDLIDGVPLLKDVRGSPIIGSLLFESQGSGIT
uniref:Uncharacterized protein n=1 Tax=Aegilops tauschii subsp. strangulata TaxID=200361 RepID=A0A453C789_AEGTS